MILTAEMRRIESFMFGPSPIFHHRTLHAVGSTAGLLARHHVRSFQQSVVGKKPPELAVKMRRRSSVAKRIKPASRS